MMKLHEKILTELTRLKATEDQVSEGVGLSIRKYKEKWMVDTDYLFIPCTEGMLDFLKSLPTPTEQLDIDAITLLSERVLSNL